MLWMAGRMYRICLGFELKDNSSTEYDLFLVLFFFEAPRVLELFGGRKTLSLCKVIFTLLSSK